MKKLAQPVSETLQVGVARAETSSPPPFFLDHNARFLSRIQQILGVVGLLIAILLLLGAWLGFSRPSGLVTPSTSSNPFIASIDTMKESRDTETRPISLDEIKSIVELSASINTNYITVDTHWDYPVYMKEWIDAIRSTGRHVWFRTHPNQWENDNGSTGIMTPQQYETAESQFILANPSFFQAGDIFDPCPEPENGLYWKAEYGNTWTSNAPNAATQAYNAFLRDTTDVADAALQQDGISGVITTVHSTNSFFAITPSVLESATVQKFGYITVDSYPEGNTTNPKQVAQARVNELNQIENLWHVPIIIGEMGYSNSVPVNDATQKVVLKAEFNALKTLPYLLGLNYWVGPGTRGDGGYTNVFVQVLGVWQLRPAAHELAAFFKGKIRK